MRTFHATALPTWGQRRRLPRVLLGSAGVFALPGLAVSTRVRRAGDVAFRAVRHNGHRARAAGTVCVASVNTSGERVTYLLKRNFPMNGFGCSVSAARRRARSLPFQSRPAVCRARRPRVRRSGVRGAWGPASRSPLHARVGGGPSSHTDTHRLRECLLCAAPRPRAPLSRRSRRPSDRAGHSPLPPYVIRFPFSRPPPSTTDTSTRAFQPMITSCTPSVCLSDWLSLTHTYEQGPRREKGARAAAWIYRLSMRPPESISEVSWRTCSLLQSESTLEANPTDYPPRRYAWSMSSYAIFPYLSSRPCTEPLAVGGR